MSKCYFCKNELQKDMPCANCGAILVESLYSMKFLESKRDFSQRDVYYTDKYIISKKTGNALGMFGLIGSLIGTAVDEMKKNFEVYEVSEIKDIVYPIEYKGTKKNCAIKFIDKNGENFITTFYNMKRATEAYETLCRSYLNRVQQQSTYCRYCGTEIPDGVLYCPKDGQKIR